MRVQSTRSTYTALFEPEDFPKKELLENHEYFQVPKSYAGESEDPYLLMAFNNALKQGRSLLLYSESISVSSSHSNSRPDAEHLMMTRFDISFMGSGIALEESYKTILAGLKQRNIVKTNIQICYYLIAELLEQEYLAQTTFLRSMEYDDFKNYFKFMIDDTITLTTLPSLEDLHKYRFLTETLMKGKTSRYTPKLQALFEEHSSDLWKYSQLLTFENIQSIYTMFKENVISNFSAEEFFELTKMFIHDPEETKALLLQTPSTWLSKLFNTNKTE